MTKTLIVKQSDPPVTKEVLAESITKISEGFDTLLKQGLNRDAIVVLLHDAVKSVGKRDIIKVLNALTNLRRWYCR